MLGRYNRLAVSVSTMSGSVLAVLLTETEKMDGSVDDFARSKDTTREENEAWDRLETCQPW